MAGEAWLGAEEAARRLGLQPRTLYAYVSRGQLRRRPGPDGRRSEYHPDDVAALAVRGRRARPSRPTDIILPTAVTAITEQGPAYRGQLATESAGVVRFEQVAALLWDVPGDEPWETDDAVLAAARAATRQLDHDVDPAQRLLVVTAAARTADPLANELRPNVVARTARSLITTLASASTGGAPRLGSVAEGLAAAVAGATVSEEDAVAVIDAALVLLADHELAASTLAARIAASARCDPYAVELAGLAVLSGRRHGAASRILERVLDEVVAGTDAATALAKRLHPEEPAPGFGHPLYPHGDPRAIRLLELLLDRPIGAACFPLLELLATARQRGLPEPNIDAVLAGLTHAIGAREGTGELLFALARSAGWMAHALEQYADPQLLRPKAVYTGP